MTTTAPEGGAPSEAPAELVDAVLRLMPDAAILVDAAGTITAANSLAEKCFRYPNSGMAGSAVEALIPAQVRPRHVRHRSAFAARPGQRPMGAGLELWAVRRDGSEFPVDISLTPVLMGGQQLTMAAIRDITAQRAEWETETRLAAIVASSDDAMMSMDLSSTVVTWNPAAARLFGYGAEEMTSRSFWRLVPPELRTSMEDRMARVRGGMRVDSNDTRRVRADGTEIDVAESLSLVTDVAGEPVGITAAMRDITERRRRELELRHLLAETQRRERWITAMSEVRLALFSGSDVDEWLDLITDRVGELIDADGVILALPAAGRPDSLEVTAAHGEGVLGLGDAIPLDSTLAGRAFRTGQAVVSENLPADSPAPPELLQGVAIGPVVLAPMVSSYRRRRGPLRHPGPGTRPLRPRGDPGRRELRPTGGARHRARPRPERPRAARVLGDRERIARDLHDHVVQRLFAVGMALQAASHSIEDTGALERIAESIEELDATIRDVRSTIFSLALRTTDRVGTSTRARLLDVTSMAAQGLGFQPRLQFDGPVDTKIPEDVRARRAGGGTRGSCRMRPGMPRRHTSRYGSTSTTTSTITVSDNGVGIGDTTRSSGLANLRARAEARGGSMAVGKGEQRGTRLHWRVPLPT